MNQNIFHYLYPDNEVDVIWFEGEVFVIDIIEFLHGTQVGSKLGSGGGGGGGGGLCDFSVYGFSLQGFSIHDEKLV